MASTRTLEQLLNLDDPGITLVRAWISATGNSVEELPVERASGERALVALQVTSRSPMGAVALETGGLLIDHGWIRVLGGGHARLPRSIHEWNGINVDRPSPRLRGAVLVADDAIGGFFAVNGGAFPGPPGHVFYYSPGTLRWDDIASSYSEWLAGMISGDMKKFYAGERWPGWEKDVAALPGDRAFSVYPFLFTEGPQMAKRSRSAVPVEELWRLYIDDLPKQLTRRLD